MINSILELNQSTKIFLDYNGFYKIACEPEILLTQQDIISVTESDKVPEKNDADYYFENYKTLKITLNKKAQNKIKKIEKSIPFKEDSDGNKTKTSFLFCATSDNYNFVLDFKDNNLFIYYALPEDLEHFKNILN